MYSVLVGRPEGKRPLGMPRHRWEEVGCGVDWIELAEDRQVVGTWECSNKPLGCIESGEFLDWLTSF